MDKTTYNRIKKILKEAIEEFDRDTLTSGVDLLPEEYENIILNLKKKVVEKMGADWDDFRKADHAVRGLTKTKVNFALKDLKNRIDNIKIPSSEEIKQLALEVLPAPQIINKTEIVKEIVKEKPTFVNKVIKETIRELDRTQVDEIEKDFKTLQTSHQELWERVGQLKIPEPIDLEAFKIRIDKESANALNKLAGEMPNFRALAMGLQGQIDETKTLLKAENLWDRSGTVLSPHTANDSLNLGSGNLNSASIYNYNRNFLKDWSAQISKLKTEKASSQAIIAWIGDSWTTQSISYTTDLSRYLRLKFGDSGVGYYGANQYSSAGGYLYTRTGSGLDALGASRAFAGTWTDNTIYTKGASISTTESTDIATPATITYVGYATDFVIHWIRQTNGGTFTWAIDGGAETAIDTAGAAAIQFTSITGLTNGQHTLVLKVTIAGTDGVEIAGVEIKKSGNGVRIDNLGLSGSRASYWALADSTFQTALTQLAPNMVVITLGVNDLIANRTPTQYVADLTTIVANVLTAMPRCSIVIFTPSDIGSVTTYAMSEYIAVAKAYALANNYGFIDNYSLIGDYATANTRGLYTNTTHLNQQGGNLLSINFRDYFNDGLLHYWTDLTSCNTFYGQNSMVARTTGNYNTAFGASSLLSLTTGSYNMAFGNATLSLCTTGTDNVAIGNTALNALVDGIRNIAIGSSAAVKLVDGDYNIAIGFSAMSNGAVSGNYNIGIGYLSAYNIIGGGYNSFFGASSGYTVASGNYNTAGGYEAYKLGTGSNNTAFGFRALATMTGNGGVAFGYCAGRYETEAGHLFIDGIDRSTEAAGRTNSLLYGTFNATVASQQLTINAGTLNFNPGVDYDLTINFIGTGYSGIMKWMEDEAYWTFSHVLRGATSLYRRYYHIPLESSNPGASGPTWVVAGVNTTGGWRLDASTELLRGQADIHSDWDGATDLTFSVNFMVNVNNTGGLVTDTVDLKATVYYKGVGDVATKSQVVEVATVVGQSAQYKQFKANFTINFDETSNVVEVGDVLSVVLNLETDTSEVDDIVVTSMEFYYQTTHSAIESGDV